MELKFRRVGLSTQFHGLCLFAVLRPLNDQVHLTSGTGQTYNRLVEYITHECTE